MVVLAAQVAQQQTAVQVAQHRHLVKEMLAQVLAVRMVHLAAAVVHRLQGLMSQQHQVVLAVQERLILTLAHLLLMLVAVAAVVMTLVVAQVVVVQAVAVLVVLGLLRGA